MPAIWRKEGLLQTCCVPGAISLLSGDLFVEGPYPGPILPHPIEPRMPLLHIPLPEEGAEAKAFKGLNIPPKRERLPDERTIQVKQFTVGRLIPKSQMTDLDKAS